MQFVTYILITEKKGEPLFLTGVTFLILNSSVLIAYDYIGCVWCVYGICALCLAQVGLDLIRPCG